MDHYPAIAQGVSVDPREDMTIVMTSRRPAEVRFAWTESVRL